MTPNINYSIILLFYIHELRECLFNFFSFFLTIIMVFYFKFVLIVPWRTKIQIMIEEMFARFPKLSKGILIPRFSQKIYRNKKILKYANLQNKSINNLEEKSLVVLENIYFVKHKIFKCTGLHWFSTF